MNKIYEKGQFIILDGDSQYILMNKHKGFDIGHTHLKNYKTALWLIKLAEHRSIPHHISLYLLESLIRVSEDEIYVRHLKELQESKRNRTRENYYNKGNFQYRKYRKKKHK